MPGFGDLEAAIMEAIWSADEPLTVRTMVDQLNQERPLAYTTVQTVTEILYRKGWLQREKEGRAYRYWARRSREDYTAGLVEEALSAAPDRTAALVRLFKQMGPGEASELRAALDTAKNSGENQ